MIKSLFPCNFISNCHLCDDAECTYCTDYATDTCTTCDATNFTFATNKCTCKNGFGRDSAQEKYVCKAPDFLTAIDSSTTLKYYADACPSGYTVSSPVCTAPSGDDLYTVLMNTKATCRLEATVLFSHQPLSSPPTSKDST